MIVFIIGLTCGAIVACCAISLCKMSKDGDKDAEFCRILANRDATIRQLQSSLDHERASEVEKEGTKQ